MLLQRNYPTPPHPRIVKTFFFRMSCFAVSKLTGKCGGSPAKKTGNDDSPGKGAASAVAAGTGPTYSPAPAPKKKNSGKSSGLSNIEIVQEIPPATSRSGIPGSPVPPSTPNLQLRRHDPAMMPASPHQQQHNGGFQFYCSPASYQPQHSV